MLINGILLEYEDAKPVVRKPYLTDIPGKYLWVQLGRAFFERIKDNAHHSFITMLTEQFCQRDISEYHKDYFAHQCFEFVCSIFDDEDLDDIDDEGEPQDYDAFLLKYAKVLIKLKYDPFQPCIKFCDVLFILYFVIHQRKYQLAKFMIYDLAISCFTSKVTSMSLINSYVEQELMLKFFIRERDFFDSDDIKELFGDKFNNLQKYFIVQIDKIVHSHKLKDKIFILSDSVALLNAIYINFISLLNVLKNNIDFISTSTCAEDLPRFTYSYELKENFNSIFFFLSAFGLWDLAELQTISDECFFRLFTFFKLFCHFGHPINLANPSFSSEMGLSVNTKKVASSSKQINLEIKTELLALYALINNARLRINPFIMKVSSDSSCVIVSLEQKQKKDLSDFMSYFRQCAKVIVESFVKCYILECMNQYVNDEYEDANFFIRAVFPFARNNYHFGTDFTNEDIKNRILNKLRELNRSINGNATNITQFLLNLVNDMTQQLGISFCFEFAFYKIGEMHYCEKYFERLSLAFCTAYCTDAPSKFLECVDEESIIQAKIEELKL